MVPDHILAIESKDATDALMAGLSIKPIKETGPRGSGASSRKGLDTKQVNQRIWKNFGPIGKDTKMYGVRSELPAWNSQQEILRAVKGSQVVVISGMTGKLMTEAAKVNSKLICHQSYNFNYLRCRSYIFIIHEQRQTCCVLFTYG